MLPKPPFSVWECDEQRLFEVATLMILGFTTNNLRPRQNRCIGQPRPEKTRADLRTKKVLYAIAFDAYGSLAQVCVPKGETVTSKFYSDQVTTAIE